MTSFAYILFVTYWVFERWFPSNATSIIIDLEITPFTAFGNARSSQKIICIRREIRAIYRVNPRGFVNELSPSSLQIFNSEIFILNDAQSRRYWSHNLWEIWFLKPYESTWIRANLHAVISSCNARLFATHDSLRIEIMLTQKKIIWREYMFQNAIFAVYWKKECAKLFGMRQLKLDSVYRLARQVNNTEVGSSIPS